MVSRSPKLISHSCLHLVLLIIFCVSCLVPNNVQADSADKAFELFDHQGKNTDRLKYRTFGAEIRHVRGWAQKFGEELWDLAKKMTKSTEIKKEYKINNARVEQKDGEELRESIMRNVEKMLSRKMDAIKCIQTKAEELAESFDYNETYALNFTYYSSKYSMYNGRRAVVLVESLEEFAPTYINMTLNQDTHFYNISVNTTHSSVHVPSNIYDRNLKTMQTIMWSEGLDDVFVQNYKADPALSWQYFGSDTGILRHYPALQWDIGDRTDIYDCRKRSWYIETATCSKDIVILLDNSGSMYGFRNHVAKFTIRSVLETFSNNDFFTIFNYSATVDDIIPCFKDVLVQATPENIEVFNDAIVGMQPEGYANLSIAYTKAFEILKKYYIQRRCNESVTGCNQAIMVVTDGVAGNTTEVFEKYNWGIGENSTKMGVRVFTYLLGKEVTKVREIQWMACDNRGYYSHVQTLDEVHEEVLKYVDVIATPLVLQNELHPPTWTHAFADTTYKQEDNNAAPRLMIAVGVPAFDRAYKQKNSTRKARLLGVAGTDIPVEDIDKITLPYKLGVNGYPFVVSNNGYVLLHPDLRPVQKKWNQLKDNYNSIDLTEVEQLADDNVPRQPGEAILQLRLNMVNNEKGKLENVSVKLHYDEMRRVSIENQTYFYAPLPNTPFSLGLVLPSVYGMTWFKVGNQVQKNSGNISDYFVGENWKVHPQWVYCKYHYLEGHEFQTPEQELRHFLKKMTSPEWKWFEQYEADPITDYDDDDEPNCGRKTLDDDAYYCNQELVQLLIFDAKVTSISYGAGKFLDINDPLINRYNATLRFVATMSGLTRWQFIFGEVEVDTDKEFGDFHTTAIDETWYKSAIFQHAIDPESFVYSVPHIGEAPENQELMVTASHAIFPRDGGKEAPGCVVGFQFSHALMAQNFFNVTSKQDCNGCIDTCDSDMHDCYLIDNNGYIIVSEVENDTGRFFGEINGAVMQEMVELSIFKNITVYDFQGLCKEETVKASDATTMLNPIQLIGLTINWIVTEMIWYWGHVTMWVEGVPFYDDLEYGEEDHDLHPTKKPKVLPEEHEVHIKGKDEIITKYYPCDTKSHLFVLNQEMFIKGNDFNEEVKTICSHPFHVKRIPHSNLLLVVIKAKTSACKFTHTASPQIIMYEQEFPCYKLNLSFLERRRLEECFTTHPDEEEFTYCGRATSIGLEYAVAVISATILVILRYFH